ncbi:leukocyte immunoglobulin-like receptor subfamily B member 2 [Macrotis lagotis]|uniref:leukocyte immunoglobulin-like receptor subfamily B member 2 n=1 Tax=Macrotis lagotis TaxID=92651 RepID=UPI003D68CD42
MDLTDTFPRPTLWAVPSPVIPQGADVTLRCQGRLGSDRIQLWVDGELKEERNASWEPTEFILQNVSALRDARSYCCRSRQKSLWSELSDPLNLVVMTGKFPKPTLGVQPGLMMPQGSNITLWCSRPKLSALGEVTFILWKVGTQESLQHQTSTDLWTSFLLPSVRPEDTGNYSCNYWERIHSFRGSEPSDVLELVVLGESVWRRWAQNNRV